MLPIFPFLAALLRNLGCGLQVVFFLRVSPAQLRVSWTQVIALIALGLLPPLLDQWVASGGVGRLVATGLPGALFQVPLLLLAAWALARLAQMQERTATLLVALLSAALLLDAIGRALPYFTAELPEEVDPYRFDAVFRLLPALWLALAAAVAAARLLQLQPRLRLPALLIALVVVAWPLGSIGRNDLLWAPSYADSGERDWAAYTAAADEKVLYGQVALLQQQLATLQPGRAGVVDLFFVGVAADAEQDVFMREVQSIEQLFAQRFAEPAHILALINNRTTLDTVPLASASALTATLQRVAAVMDRDEDILFLYLTSHGSEDHRLSVQFPPLQLHDIEPAQLRRMLDDTGIVHRVVVVSACYSGGFVDALRNDDTLVITAAAADRTSFGCSNEADFTYFGKAYFDEALRHTFSFIDAFATAKVSIAEREQQQGFELSDPQIVIGKNIAGVLARWQAQQAAAESGAGNPQ